MYNYPWYPPWVPPQPPTKPDMSPKELKQWIKLHKEWEDLVAGKPKPDKPKAKTFSATEVFIILLAVSPFIAIAYKPFLQALMR